MRYRYHPLPLLQQLNAMTTTRRAFLAQSATLAAAPVALAKAPLSNGTAVSVHRMKLGSFEVTTLLDGFIDINPAVLMGDQDLIKRHLEAAGLWGSPIRTAVNTFMVNTGEKLVMIDCGGAKMLGPNAGRVPQALAQLGIEPGQVDEVYITHMHGDHLHGAVTPEGARMFPNAVLRIAKPDVDYWGSAEVEAAAPADQKWRFVAAKRAMAAYGDRLQTFEAGIELTPGIRSVNAYGHTPGHTCYLVSSGSARLLLLGDTLHVAPVQFPRPEITVGFDHSQDQARAKRRGLLEMAARDNILIGAVHLPFPGIGRLREKEGAFSYEPLPWQLY
jgi:glyoxylase-like metal-dependent hydrolase (beta-lactamase superfamily II)